jgi:predicted PurR-regulated permease PerM
MSERPLRHDEFHPDIVVESAIRIALIAVMLALCYWIMKPFLIPIAWAVIIAVASWPGYDRLVQWLGGRRGLASAVFVLIALVVLIVPIVLLSGTLVEGTQDLARRFDHGGFRVPSPPDLSHIPVVGETIQSYWAEASDNLQGLLQRVEPQLKALGRWIFDFATTASVGLVHFLLAIVIAAVLMAKREIGSGVTRAVAVRLAGNRGEALARLAEAVVRSVTRGILGVAVIQSLLAGLGMLVAGVPGAGLWALLALLLSTIQLGVFPIMLPAAIYVFYHANLTTSVLFLIWSVLVGSLDNILKPILLGRGVSVPMAVIFIGAIGGFIGAGIIGLFVGSVILTLGYELFLAWVKEDDSARYTIEHMTGDADFPPGAS